jgi:hypothetical protein
MRLSITKAIHDVGEARFRQMLKSGSFPKVNYREEVGGSSYNMIDYSTTWATFMKVLDKRMIDENLDTRLGVFTRKHSESFLGKVRELAEAITESDVHVQPERFKTMWD